MVIGFLRCLVVWIVGGTCACAQIAMQHTVLVKNINRAPIGDGPLAPRRLGDVVVFAGFTPGSGLEWWRVDPHRKRGATRIRDIAPGSASALDPNRMVHLEVSGVLYFAATDGVHGRTLWRTDGSEAGTVAVQDGAEGSAIFDPYDFVGLNGLLLGAARLGGSFETGVWVSDGTRGGTSWLRRWERGQISRLSVFAGAVWFTVNVGPDSELWKTDGTVGGTVRATVLEGQSIQPWSLSPANGRMYLFAYTSTGSVGGSLWASDESGSHVVRVRERVPGASGDPGTVFEADGYFYFEAGDPVRRLWRTDGTSDGTTAIGPSILGEVFRADPGLYLTGVRSNETELWTVGSARGEAIRIRAFTNVSGQYRPPSGFLRLGTKVIFQATESEEGAELWGSDGTSGGTKRLADLVPGKASGFPWPLGRVGGLGLIGARDADGGASLWRTDGTEAGTERIRILRPGQPGTYSWVASLVGGEVSGRVYAWVGTGRSTEAPAEPAELPPFELWVTDGTANGTRSLATFDSRSGAGPVFMAEVGKVVLFTVPKEHGSYEVWRTDGTPEGTFVVRDAFPERDAGSGPWSLVERRGRLFFLMKDDAYLDQLWSSDGTSAGTSPVHAWAASDESAWNAPELVNVSDTLFFVRVTSKGSALWRSDGTDAGTLPVVVRDVTIDGLAGAGGRLFFREGDGGLGTSDGTAAGTRIVRRFDQILPGPKGKGPIACGDRVYFVAATGDVGSELRVSDGTEAGTRLVRDLTPGAAGSQLTGLTPVGERLFFARSDGPDTWSLWVTDGTDTGTVRLRGFQNGPAPRWDWASLGGRLLFTASDAVAGDEPWASDGTVEGTVRLKDVVSGDQGSYPRRITPGGKRAFFWAYSGEGYDLWRTDGTEAGTERVKANTPWHSPYDEITTVVDDVVYFFGPVGLWRSDGTEGGTRPVSNPSGLDLRLPFPDSMGPAQYLVPVGGTVFFIADDGVSGFELWKYGEADADGDGLSDAWEARFFGGRARPDEDPDGDGMSNRDEFRAGTDPAEARSILNIEVNRDAEAGVVQLKWASTPGREYVLQRSRGVRGVGEALERRIPATPPLNVFREAVAEGRGPVVYRVQVEE